MRELERLLDSSVDALEETSVRDASARLRRIEEEVLVEEAGVSFQGRTLELVDGFPGDFTTSIKLGRSLFFYVGDVSNHGPKACDIAVDLRKKIRRLTRASYKHRRELVQPRRGEKVLKDVFTAINAYLNSSRIPQERVKELKRFLRRNPPDYERTAKIRELKQEARLDSSFTCLLGGVVYEPSDVLVLINALGTRGLLHRYENDAVTLIPSSSAPPGIVPHRDQKRVYRRTLQPVYSDLMPGDSVLMFTDGLSEMKVLEKNSRNGKRKRLQPIREAGEGCVHHKAIEAFDQVARGRYTVKQAVEATLDMRKDYEVTDDLTMAVVHRKHPSEYRL